MLHMECPATGQIDEGFCSFFGPVATAG